MNQESISTQLSNRIGAQALQQCIDDYINNIDIHPWGIEQHEGFARDMVLLTLYHDYMGRSFAQIEAEVNFGYHIGHHGGHVIGDNHFAWGREGFTNVRFYVSREDANASGTQMSQT
jgi:hypothetical protein